MAQHAHFTIHTGVQVYFCDRRNPWQSGTNETPTGQTIALMGAGAALNVTPGGSRLGPKTPIRSDAKMNIPSDRVDLRAITPFEDAFVVAAADDLKRRGTWRAALRSKAEPTLPTGSSPPR